MNVISYLLHEHRGKQIFLGNIEYSKRIMPGNISTIRWHGSVCICDKCKEQYSPEFEKLKRRN